MSSSRKKRKSHFGAGASCAYCGRPATTIDHVFPECLFVPPRPEMMKVPTCGACNDRKSKDDTFLRDMLIFDVRCGHHPTVNKLIEPGGKLERAMRGGQSLIAKHVATRSRSIELTSPTGLFIAQSAVVELDENRVKRMMVVIARGVYFAHTRMIAPPAGKYTVTFYQPSSWPTVESEYRNRGVRGAYHIGTEIHYLYAHVKEDPCKTICAMNFYGGFVAVAQCCGGSGPRILPTGRPE